MFIQETEFLVEKYVVKPLFTRQMAIGKILKTPDGRTVKIECGEYRGAFGLNNWWGWREQFPDGTTGPLEHGFGWV